MFERDVWVCVCVCVCVTLNVQANDDRTCDQRSFRLLLFVDLSLCGHLFT